jgi:hypothetical protein
MFSVDTRRHSREKSWLQCRATRGILNFPWNVGTQGGKLNRLLRMAGIIGFTSVFPDVAVSRNAGSARLGSLLKLLREMSAEDVPELAPKNTVKRHNKLSGALRTLRLAVTNTLRVLECGLAQKKEPIAIAAVIQRRSHHDLAVAKRHFNLAPRDPVPRTSLPPPDHS